MKNVRECGHVSIFLISHAARVHMWFELDCYLRLLLPSLLNNMLFSSPTIRPITARLEECNNVAWPAKTDPDACFGIVLPNRTYYLVAPSVAAAREWHLDLARLARSADFGLCLEAQSADSTHRPSAGSSSSASTLVGAHSDSSSSHRPSAGSGASVATLTTAEVAGRIARDRQDSASASAAPTGKEDNSFGGAEAAF